VKQEDPQEDWRPTASPETLIRRAEIIRDIRNWFHLNSVLEVETPQLSHGATTDPQIESFSTGARYLRTSAEFHLKRLLASGVSDLYELGKVFRLDESGRNHNPEFTMLEWYRRGMDHHQLIAEVESLLQYLHKDPALGIERISYRALWKNVTDLDVAKTSCEGVVAFLEKSGISVPESVADDFDALQDLAMGTTVADSLAANQYTCIYDYPASQASLARIDSADPDWPVASRFEVYYGSIELANGFHELTDAIEQQQRFEADNESRKQNNKKSMPIDVRFIASLQHGMPDCAGVAIGIDRLLMVLMDNIDHLQEVISFNWHRA